MEFYSFLPLWSRRLGGNLLAVSSSALLCPFLASRIPRHQGLHQASAGTSRHRARFRGQPGAGEGAQLLPGHLMAGHHGLQHKGAVTPSANWVVGPDPGLTEAKRVLSVGLESWCSPAFKPRPSQLHG